VLGTKHLDGSSSSAAIKLTPSNARYFTLTANNKAYILRSSFKKLSPRITVYREDLTGFVDILKIDNIDNIYINKLSSIERILITTTDYVNNEPIDVQDDIILSQDSRKAMFTKQFIEYVRENKWTIDAKNNFVFSLENWDYSLPIFTLPNKEYSFSDHSDRISKVIESRMTDIKSRTLTDSPIKTLQELFTLVNEKLNVNLAVIEVIIYANMIKNKDSFALAGNSPEATMHSYQAIINGRSLSAVYAYQFQHKVISDPRSFYKFDRPDHPMDVLISPDEVLKYYP
jgi:hypothetical protein